MKYLKQVFIASGIIMMLAACGGSPDTTPGTSGGHVTTPVDTTTTPPDKTIIIAGKEFTCGQVIGAENEQCDAGFQKAFNRWGDNIPAYVDSGKLGPLGNNLKTDANPDALMRYEDVAAGGLGACIVGASSKGLGDQDAQTKFIDWLLKSFPDEARTSFLPFWFEASRSLCPDAFSGAGDFESHDMELP